MANDAAIDAAQAESRQKSMALMLEKLSDEHGRSMAYIERALMLPQRTLARWKTGDGFSAASAALLRLITTFPWLLEVADARFAPRFADTAVVVAASAVLQTFTLHALSPEHVQQQWQAQPSIVMAFGDGAVGVGFPRTLGLGNSAVLEAVS